MSKLSGFVLSACYSQCSCPIFAATLHDLVLLHFSFAGVGLAEEPAPALLARVKKKPPCVATWRAASVLVVDEVSMIDGVLFDKIEYIARAVRGNVKPFGGLQVILCGTLSHDFPHRVSWRLACFTAVLHW